MTSWHRWCRRHRLQIIFIVVAVNLAQFTDAGRSEDWIVNTSNGRIRGIRYHFPSKRSVDAFLGIPFAKPPTGHLRFRPPQPSDDWTGIYNATKLPNSCYQSPDNVFGDFRGSTMWNPNTRVSEDCLYLNIWVPTHPRVRKSAVMIWIFGGGFSSGTSTLNLYDGKILARENNIIVASIGYRVGALGFLALGHPSAPGNAGMYDQLMALEWIQQNIRFFGGDPSNVTLFGESAGSVSVSLHLLSPLSRPKFARAILQSGVANMPWATVTMDEGRRRSLELAFDILDCPETDDMDSVATCLRTKSPQTLVDNQWVVRGIMQFPFVPVIDGTFLVEHPSISLERGAFKPCPILLGSNLNEATFFLIYELTDSLSLTKSSMTRGEFVESIDRLFHYYPAYPQTNSEFGLEAIKHHYTNWLDVDDQLQNILNLDAASGDFQFVCNVNVFAQAYAKHGENVYMYYFTERYEINPWPKWMGVLHADEIVFIFGETFKPGSNYTAAEKDLSRQIMQYWTNFAKSGDPNREPGRSSLNEWPLHSPKGKEYLELNSDFLRPEKKEFAVKRGPRAQECAFWTEYLPQLVTATKDLSAAELEWKHQFNEWSTKYIVDWKLQYDKYMDHQNQKCGN